MATTIGKYTLEQELGRGPLGKVYVAVHTETGQKVVFRGFAKPQKVDKAHWKESIARFTNELTAARQLNHPNIAALYDFGEIGSLYYVVTEYFEGQSFRSLVDEHGPQQIDAMTPLVEQACHAMDYAGSLNVNHGDLTPYNILVLPKGQVKIINYGLSHCRHKLGSPYLAPEQLTGFAGDLRSDVYSLGVVLYELLKGEVPFRGDSLQELCQRIATVHPPPLLNVPDYVQGVIAKMLAKSPEERYQAAAHVTDDLAAGRIPEGFEAEVVRPAAVATSWHESHYQPLPSLADYKLDEREIAETKAWARARRKERAAARRVWVRRAAFALAGILLVVLVMDTIKMSRREALLTIAGKAGRSEKYLAKQDIWVPILYNDYVFLQGDRIRTTKGARLTLETREGTRIQIAPQSELWVETFSYEPAKRLRERKFLLMRGRVWANVKKLQSHNSTFAIASGGCVVRVTGTVFGLMKAGNDVGVTSHEGQVQVAAGGAERVLPAGTEITVEPGEPLGEGEELSEEERKLLSEQDLLLAQESALTSLRNLIAGTEESTVLPLIAKVMSAESLNPIKSVQDSLEGGAGLAKAMTALHGIATLLEGEEQYPETLNLTTLEELFGSDKEGADRTLKCFEGNRLESYKLVPKGYEITARVADKKHTLLRLRNGKVEAASSTPPEQGGGGGEGSEE